MYEYGIRNSLEYNLAQPMASSGTVQNNHRPTTQASSRPLRSVQEQCKPCEAHQRVACATAPRVGSSEHVRCTT